MGRADPQQLGAGETRRADHGCLVHPARLLSSRQDCNYVQNKESSCRTQARRMAPVRRDVSSMQRWRASATSASVRVRSGAWNRNR